MRGFFVLWPTCTSSIRQKVNKYYVGACTNLERRLYEHNIGHSTFTSTGIPWELKYTEEFSSLPEAKKREKEIKNRNQGSILNH